MFRWSALAILVAALSVSARLRSRARVASGTIRRSEESLGLIAGRLMVGLPLFASVLIYVIRPEWMAWAALDFPALVRWSGVALGVTVVPAVYWVLVTIGSNVSETILTKEDHQLVTSGPYRWVRHPLYVAGIGLFTSLGLVSANAFILGWTVLALIAVRVVVVPREESALVAEFGDDYRRYQQRTGALLPRI